MKTETLLLTNHFVASRPKSERREFSSPLHI